MLMFCDDKQNFVLRLVWSFIMKLSEFQRMFAGKSSKLSEFYKANSLILEIPVKLCK